MNCFQKLMRKLFFYSTPETPIEHPFWVNQRPFPSSLYVPPPSPLRPAPNGEGMIDVSANRESLADIFGEQWWHDTEKSAISDHEKR